jgi:hypothetical protein
MAELSKVGSDIRATTSCALKQPSASESRTVRSGLERTARRIRLRASSSLIIANHFNPERFLGQSAISDSDENREHATNVGVGNPQFFAIFSLLVPVRLRTFW